MPAESVAVLGCGNMGSAMARRLAEQGFEVVLYNRTRERAEALAGEIGARTAGSPGEAADAADVLVTMVADDDALRALCTEDDGILAGGRPDGVTLQTSTVLPDTVREMGEAFAARGLAFVDAPVSGSTATAGAGELTFMVGGDEADVDRARPVLDALGKRTIRIGPVGSAAAVKLAVNDIIFALDVAVSEALVLAEAAGVDREAAYDVFAGGAAGAPFVQYKRGAFLSPETTPPAFTFDLALKDLSLILALAGREHVPMSQATTNMAALRAAANALGGDRDFSEVATYLRSQTAS
jgi:3-hydroxyisobutyrate dehydrogenase-like beta-hydroxyacid dehydrogenase